MRDRSINERLFRKATKENLLGIGEPEIAESAPVANVEPSLRPFIPGIVIALSFDLIALLVCLTVNVIAGFVMFGIVNYAYLLWLFLRARAIQRSRSAPSTKEQGEEDD